MELVGYVAAAAVVVFGVFVVRRLLRSWREVSRDDPSNRDHRSP
jgi:hypothetical protein